MRSVLRDGASFPSLSFNTAKALLHIANIISYFTFIFGFTQLAKLK